MIVKMKFLIMFVLLTFSISATAEWIENKNIEWWFLEYSQKQCFKAKDLGRDYHPVILIKAADCVFEKENSTVDRIASIGCEKTLNTGFIFATNKEDCDSYLAYLLETMKVAE